MDGAGEGLKFYLVPSVEPIKEGRLGEIITAAMGQAFFTLSVGIGSIAIFGSYIGRDRSLLGEAITITGLPSLGWRKHSSPACKHWLLCPSSGFLWP